MANILLKLTGDAADAKAVLDDTIAEVKDFGKQKATADLRVDAEQAKRDIAEVVAEMEAVPKEETIRIRVAAEQAKLQGLLARKAGLEQQLQNAAATGEETDPLIKRLGSYSSQIESVRGRITSLASDFDHLGEDGAEDVEKVVRNFTGLNAGLTKSRTGLVSLVSSIVGKVPLIGGLFSKLAEGVGQLATTLLPDAAEGVGGLVSGFVGLIGTGVGLGVVVAAMSALAVAIAQALIGIVALGVAFLVALGPIVVLLGVVADKIKDIVSGQQALASANANLKSAIDAQKSAVTQLHQAEQTESTTRIAAIAAERQAYDAELDAINQVNDAKLGIQTAKLQLDQARLTLAEFKQQLAGLGTTPGDLFGGSQNVAVGGNLGQTQTGSDPLALQQILLQYQEDLNDVKQGVLGTKDAVGTLRDAITNQVTVGQQWALYLKLGLKAYQPFASAVNAVVTAQENLKRSDDQLAAAELSKAQAIKHGNTEASAFIKVWDLLKKTFGKILGPGEAAIFKGIEQAMGIMAGHGKTLTPAFLKLGEAIGQAFVWWAKMMTKPGNVKLIAGLISDAAGFTETMSHWLGKVFQWLVIITVAAMPFLLKIIKHWTSELGGTKDKTKDIHDFIVKCIKKAKTFWDGLLMIGTVVVKLQGFFKGLWGIVGLLVGSLEKVVTLYQIIAATQAANRQASTVGVSAAEGSAALITKDEALLRGKLSSRMRTFLQTQIANLQSQMSDVVKQGGMGLQLAAPKVLQYGAAHAAVLTAPRGGNTYIEHQHVAENANTMGDPDHFARKLRKGLVAQGGVR